MFLYVLVIVAVFLASWHVIRRKQKRFQNLPNGPRGIPIIGNILQLGQKPYIALSKWAEKFGPLYTIDLFGTPAVVINDPKIMRDLFSNPNSTGKYSTVTIDVVHSADYGLVGTEGSVWFEQHKFFMQVLRKFGLRGGNQLDPTILTECNDLCNWIDNELKGSKCESMNLDEALLHSAANIVWNAVTGVQHASNKNKIVTLLDKLIKRFNDATILMFMPWLRFIAPELTGWNELVKTGEEYHGHIKNFFNKRKLARKLSTENSIPSNVIDAYIYQVENCQDTQSTFYGENGMRHSFYAVASLLLGGGETTSSTVKWLIHYLLAYPDVQIKLQAEVDGVSKKEGENIATIDKNRLPYLNAVILEVLRITTLTPCGVVQRLLDDVTYEGFIFPKGTFLLANIYHAHMDINVWKDPKTFRPERFLEGTEVERKRLRDCVVAFQEGRRKCPGEQVAKHVIFWYTFKLVEKYSFHKEENRSVEEYLEPVSGFLLLPPHLPIVVKPRNI